MNSNIIEITRHDLKRLIYERNELFEGLLRMVQQHCREHGGVYETGFLSANAFASEQTGTT